MSETHVEWDDCDRDEFLLAALRELKKRRVPAACGRMMAYLLEAIDVEKI